MSDTVSSGTRDMAKQGVQQPGAPRRNDAGKRRLRQVLPGGGRKTIGAWCFVEHASPVDVRDGVGLHLHSHGHAGVQAFTWIIDGELVHRDSLGNQQLMRSGEISLMTAGRGMEHSEGSPIRRSPRLQTVQLWIALPKAMRDCEPSFAHYGKLPKLALGGFSVTLLVGHLLGVDSPVVVHSPLVGIELATRGAAATTIPLRGDFEYGVLVLEGAAFVGEERVLPGELLYIGEHQTRLGMRCDGPSRVLLIGGKPTH